MDEITFIVLDNGTQRWHKNGISHRENGPASIWSNGSQRWVKDGEKP